MSNLAASRKGPLLLAGGVLAGLLYATYGGRSQPRPLAEGAARGQAAPGMGQAGVSETLQKVAGTGGARARDEEGVQALSQNDPKDTRLYSGSPSAYSKRDVDKVRGSGE